MRAIVMIGCVLLAGISFAQEEDSIRSCFESYKRAVIQHDGELAKAHVTASTLDYYQNLVKLAHNADSISISKLRLIDKLSVLSIRLQMLNNPNSRIDGQSYFSKAIKNGWVEQGGIQELQLGEITVSQDFAAAHLLRNEEETPLYFNFHYEGSWKLDLTSLLFAADEMMKETLQSSGMNEYTFIQKSIGVTEKYIVKSGLWHPIK